MFFVGVIHFHLTQLILFTSVACRIEKMFNLLNLEMGEKFFVWKSWADFKEVEIDF